MFIFKYDKKIDEECWGRIIKAGNLFGHDFPKTFHISENDMTEARNKAKDFQAIWDKYPSNFNENIKKIYKHGFPAGVICYVNTSPYSMDNYAKNYISISIKRDSEEKFLSTVIHEASHFLFRKYYTDYCHSIGSADEDIEEIKEIITAINNVVFPRIIDLGWKIHYLYREKAVEVWERTRDIKEVIMVVKGMLDEKTKNALF